MTRLLWPEAEPYLGYPPQAHHLEGSRAVSTSTTHPTPEMPAFIVEGGNRLQGEIRPAGNKNAALPALAATVLATMNVMGVTLIAATLVVPAVVARMMTNSAGRPLCERSSPTAFWRP